MKQCTEFCCCSGGGRGNNEEFISQFNASANASEQLMLIYNARSRPQNIFFHAVENAGSLLYCVDFVNLCRRDPHIFNSSQENILLIAAYSLISIDLTPGQLSVYLILAHIAYFCSFLADFISFLADFISFLADFSSFLADFGSFLAHFPVQLIFEAELIFSKADKFK